MAPGVVEVLEMVDVDHGQGQGLARTGRFGAAPLQLLVESLAIGQIGKGVGAGVTAHLLEVLAQPVHLRSGFLQLRLQGLVLALHLAGGGGQGLDDGLQRRRHVGGRQLLGDVGQGLAVVAGRLLGGVDGGGDGFQFLGQLIPCVLDLLVEPRLGQVSGGEFLGHQLGQRLADRGQAGELLGQGPFGVLHAVQEDLVVQRSRPDALRLHGGHGLAGELVGGRSAQQRLDCIRHRRPLRPDREAPSPLGHAGSYATDQKRRVKSGGEPGVKAELKPIFSRPPWPRPRGRPSPREWRPPASGPARPAAARCGRIGARTWRWPP